MTWVEFVETTPRHSIALDGIVSGGPSWDEKTLHVNFDHHDGCVREATMSTAMQVYFAIKGGLMDRFGGQASLHINDPDQDTAFACWLLKHYKLFTGVQSHPVINRLLALNDRWDITGGAFPMSLDDQLVRQHCWVFSPYTDLRKSGALASANEPVIRNCLDAVMKNLDRCLLGGVQEKDLDTRYEFLYVGERFKIVNEIGGNEARYTLFAQNLIDAYISLVARRADGRFVYTIGRRSRYVAFPVTELYAVLSAVDNAPWNGSDIIGGSNREKGSGLPPEQIRDLVEGHLRQKAQQIEQTSR